MSRKRKRDAMPGGAPMPGAKKKRTRARAERPCAYGPRDENGRCPPRPKAKRATSAREKKPCAYGPRGADGRCPKKGRESVRVGRDVRTIVSPKSSKSERQRAARDVGTTVTGHVAAEAGKSVTRALRRKSLGKRVVEAGKKLLPAAGTLGAATAGTVGASVAGGYVTSRLMRSRYRKRAQAMLNDTIKRTPPSQRNQFTPAVREQLLRQYEQYLREQDEIAFTK